MTDARRRVPRTDMLLRDPRLAAAERTLGPTLIRRAVTEAQERVRAGELPPERAAEAAVAALPRSATTLRPVVNATGVLVHTNLGRAPLSPAAVEALLVASGTTDIEFDLTSTAARRARRGRGALAALAEAVPRAEAVHVVNNNAAALALVATALAGGREIVVSRGELVEIGDGFRLPELLESTGARLVEVGTTNRTHLADYARAIGPATGCVLKIHPSNFTTTGFVSSVPIAQLAGLDVPLIHDIGSGLLSPHPALPAEPDASTSLADGADLVTASGDKLLGGPQAGLLLGRRDLVERLRTHPLARALRVDKLTLAALEATLLGPQPPTRQALLTPTAALATRAATLVDRLTAGGVDADAHASEARIGGGGAPEVVLTSAAVALPAALAAPLRAGRPAVVGRLHGDRLLLDLRTVPEGEDTTLLAAILAAATPPAATEPTP
ncbi:L-seryl-tRNA(Sec) selenium transferase [Streptomyces sedi]|uniref:L-seryl-tRNA(Sec) selenium transferase n=1 Tax=Streptomyces sedi TaxID=555059 RepID=A0A5C4VEU4_9ACTN|nr:L-seryl-tRNA(Sec) selenium transferase [Streptomyces sedi]TNM33559.1 L-seryl-tRNA(Sec) selenium transferase [Streptomyces sedi]